MPTSKPSPILRTSILTTLKEAKRLVGFRFSAWLIFTQVVAFLSAGAFLLQELLMRIAGVGFLFSIFLLWPLYASLYSVARNILRGQLNLQDFGSGFSVLGRSLGLSFFHNLLSFLIFFPFYMIISLYLFSKLGWTPEQFSSPGAFGQKEVATVIQTLYAHWPSVLAMALPAWPLQIYLQSRLFVAYHYVVQFRWPVFAALSHSMRQTANGQWRRFLLVCVAEISFPVLFPLFFISYPYKYAIYACLLQELEEKGEKSNKKTRQAAFTPKTVLKNPYLE